MKICELNFRILIILAALVLGIKSSRANDENSPDLKAILEQLPIDIDTNHINVLDD